MSDFANIASDVAWDKTLCIKQTNLLKKVSMIFLVFIFLSVFC